MSTIGLLAIIACLWIMTGFCMGGAILVGMTPQDRDRIGGPVLLVCVAVWPVILLAVAKDIVLEGARQWRQGRRR